MISSKNPGFTLIEVVVAITIAGIILSAVMVSYVSLAQTSRRIDISRQLQKETNFAMIRIADRVRAQSIDYEAYYSGSGSPEACGPSNLKVLCLGAKTKTITNPSKTVFVLKDENLEMNAAPLFSKKFKVDKAEFKISPERDPAKLSNPQYQPKAQIILEISSREEPKISLLIQTTVSSRLYE